MTHRSNSIQLATTEARCNPAGKCGTQKTCARWLAELPPTGAKLLSAGMPSGWMGCYHYIDAHALRKNAPPKPPPKPAVKGIA